MNEVSGPSKTRLAATVLLARDGEQGMELFMVVRHHEIDFASGAMVFPGGSLDPGDRDPRLTRYADGAEGMDADMLAVRTAAAREAFEECGVLLARDSAGQLVDGARTAELGELYRAPLEAGEIGIADLLEKHGLRLALDELAHFAHWVTPENMPKRFDTHFFLARAPQDHVLAHDGTESVDSLWITPSEACRQADDGERTIIFPTRVNIEKVGTSKTVAEALERAHNSKVVCVRPVVEKAEDGRILNIPIEAGYGASRFLVKGQGGQRAVIARRE